MTDNKAEVLSAIVSTYVEWLKRIDTPTPVSDSGCPICQYSLGIAGILDACCVCPISIYSGGYCYSDCDFDGYVKMMSSPIALSRARVYAEQVSYKLLKLLLLVLSDADRWR